MLCSLVFFLQDIVNKRLRLTCMYELSQFSLAIFVRLKGQCHDNCVHDFRPSVISKGLFTERWSDLVFFFLRTHGCQSGIFLGVQLQKF